ncbi:MAG TPA: tannase/feruloyl esterase family alpha/beta hydrolase [Caulobacteraceae bacterium]|jgi:feruloyl esterase
MRRQFIDRIGRCGAGILGAALTALAGPSLAQAQTPAKAQVDANLSARMPCEALAKEDFTHVPDAPAAILSAKVVAAAGGTAEYCDVTGYVLPQIQFELRLPTHSWNGRYFQVGCGGYCGVVRIQDCGPELAQNFAVAADNMGHVGDILHNPLFAADPDLRRDYGRRSTHVTAVIAKTVVERFYGARPAWSYFRGCSTGGREGLMEAAWAPDDFDGIVAGDPAFAGRLGAIANVWDAQHLLHADGTPVIPTDKLMVLHRAILAACDGLDGQKDGILSDPRACHFDVASIECKGGGAGADCLSHEQILAAKAVYDGPRNSRGERLYPGGSMFGAEASWGTSVDAHSLGIDSLRFLELWPNPAPSYSYRDFNWDTDPPKVRAALAEYDPVPPGEAPNLTAFEHRGGKLIAYHGWADGGVSPINTLDYYSQVGHRQGGMAKVRSWFRLFMVPGMFHCRGGDAPNTFDFMPAIMAWVEKGVAPDAVVATQKDTSGRVVRQRPLYAYPETAAYNGSGDLNQAASWHAATPAAMPDDRVAWIWGPAVDAAH